MFAGSAMFLVLLQFFLATAVIGVAGYQLSRYGDVIAERTGVGRTLIGVVMVAVVTSLPELASGVSAVAVAHVPNIAIGDALGSCIFNLLILLFLELGHPRASIYTLAAQSHILSSGFCVVLIGIVGLSVLVGDQLPAIGHVGQLDDLEGLALEHPAAAWCRPLLHLAGDRVVPADGGEDALVALEHVLGAEARLDRNLPLGQGRTHRGVEVVVGAGHGQAARLQQAGQRSHARPGDRDEVDAPRGLAHS